MHRRRCPTDAVGQLASTTPCPPVNFTSETISEDAAFTCDLMYVLVRGSPPVFVPVVTQLVTQPLIPCLIKRGGGEEQTALG